MEGPGRMSQPASAGRGGTLEGKPASRDDESPRYAQQLQWRPFQQPQHPLHCLLVSCCQRKTSLPLASNTLCFSVFSHCLRSFRIVPCLCNLYAYEMLNLETLQRELNPKASESATQLLLLMSFNRGSTELISPSNFTDFWF